MSEHEATLLWPQGMAMMPEAELLPGAARMQCELSLAAQFAAFAAAHSGELQVLLEEACRVAVDGLEASCAKLLIYQPDERRFVLQAGFGWQDSVVGQAPFRADANMAPGITSQSRGSVCCDLPAGERFDVPHLPIAQQSVRSINVVVFRECGKLFGILEARNPLAGEFAVQDKHFLHLIANSLEGAIGRRARQAVHDARLAESKEHSEMLLREMQHRVRNDLQGILVNLDREAHASMNPAQREGFERVGRRVLALATLYDHLLGAGVGDSVDMAVYLRALCDRITEAADFPARAIELRVHAQPLMMAPDRVVQLAVAVNELVFNAAEHAFPNGRPGTITVGLLSHGEDDIADPELTVSDDGCGFDGPRIGGAGLGFVERLTRQAGGKLSRGEGAGTHWRIALPVAAERPGLADPR